MRAIITGIGHCVPERRLTNADLEKMVDTNDEWITTRTGIKERRILEKGQGTTAMAVPAAEMAMKMADVRSDQLDMIITATVTPDHPVPSMAAIVQERLTATSCWGYDINGGCTGFLCALSTASQFIESGRYQKILVIGADKMSAIIDYQDRSTCILFGDAAGAVVLEASDDPDTGIADFQLHLDGSGAQALILPAGGSVMQTSVETLDKRLHYLMQDGRTVFKHAVNGMAKCSSLLLERNHLGADDLKLFIPHQANYRIIDAVAKRLQLPEEKLVVNIQKYGNTTAATIPLAMSEAWQQSRMTRGDWILISAFGAGFTWGSALFRWAI